MGPFQVNTCHLNDLSEIGFTPEGYHVRRACERSGGSVAIATGNRTRRSSLAWRWALPFKERLSRKYGYIRKVRSNIGILKRDGLKSLPIHWEEKAVRTSGAVTTRCLCWWRLSL